MGLDEFIYKGKVPTSNERNVSRYPTGISLFIITNSPKKAPPATGGAFYCSRGLGGGLAGHIALRAAPAEEDEPGVALAAPPAEADNWQMEPRTGQQIPRPAVTFVPYLSSTTTVSHALFTS